MKIRTILSVIFIGCLIGIVNPTLGEDNRINWDDTLIYAKTNGDMIEYVWLSQDTQYVLSKEISSCPQLSMQGNYIASTVEDTILIESTHNQTPPILVPIESTWTDCGYIWSPQEENVLLISQQDLLEKESLYILDGEFVMGEIITPEGDFPDLPGFLSDTRNNFYLFSPDHTLVLYEQCPSGERVGSEDTYYICAGISSLVIYNTETNSLLFSLSDADIETVTRYSNLLTHRELIAYNGAAWSSDGHFLAYASFNPASSSQFRLNIIEVEHGRRLDTTFPNWEIDFWKDLSWSPTQSKLLLWVKGLVTSDDTAFDPTLSHPIIYDTGAEVFTIVDQAFNLINRNGQIGLFSPSGNIYAFVDGDGQLIYIDISSGESSVLDVNVIRIIGWMDSEFVTYQRS